MQAILEGAYKEMRKKGGRSRQLSVLDMLVVTLGYYHDYRTMENIAFDYGVHKQRISEAVAWVEKVLIRPLAKLKYQVNIANTRNEVKS
jgi:predicted DNA-binding protein YlxM (UPF0122 family)